MWRLTATSESVIGGASGISGLCALLWPPDRFTRPAGQHGGAGDSLVFCLRRSSSIGLCRGIRVDVVPVSELGGERGVAEHRSEVAGVGQPPRGGWLGELGRLKGGRPNSLGVSLRRAFVSRSELSVSSIRAFLLGDLLMDLLRFKPDRRNGVTASVESARPRNFGFAAQPNDGDSRSSLPETRSPRPPGVWVESRCACAHGPALNGQAVRVYRCLRSIISGIERSVHSYLWRR